MGYCTKVLPKSLRTLLPLGRNHLPERREKLTNLHFNIRRTEDLISIYECVI